MSLELCIECGMKKQRFVWINEDDKICQNCYDKLHNLEDNVKIIQTKFPNGLIASWYDTVSYMNKKQSKRYFKIPFEQRDSIIDGTKYKIIIMEV